MATGLASGVADSILDLTFLGTAYAGNSAVYLQLHTGDPGTAGTANVATESTREQLTLGSASAGSMTTTADTNWLSVTGAETYTYASLWSASTGGTFLGSGTITASAVSVGDNFTIKAGNLTISFTTAS